MSHEVSHRDVLLAILSKLWPMLADLIRVLQQALIVKGREGDCGEALGAAEHVGQ